MGFGPSKQDGEHHPLLPEARTNADHRHSLDAKLGSQLLFSLSLWLNTRDTFDFFVRKNVAELWKMTQKCKESCRHMLASNHFVEMERLQTAGFKHETPRKSACHMFSEARLWQVLSLGFNRHLRGMNLLHHFLFPKGPIFLSPIFGVFMMRQFCVGKFQRHFLNLLKYIATFCLCERM